jgi:hypothetical protein
LPVPVLDRSQIRSLEDHLDLVLAMEPDEVEAIRALAAQLQGMKILPILGAGASYDCGMRVAGRIATDLHAECEADEELKPEVQAVASDDLGGIAEAIYKHHGDCHQAVLEAIGMPDPQRWPGTPEVEPHFCALRILARLIREHEGLGAAFSFNYDCCKEAALAAEGFSRSRQRTAGLVWIDNANVFCTKEMYVNPQNSDGFELVKAHGCVEHYRKAYEKDQREEVAEAIVIRAKQIETWADRLWARRSLDERVQKSVLLLVGFSGQDEATAVELKKVLEDICKSEPGSTPPRLVVIDRNPDTDELRELVDYGTGPGGAGESAVTKISTAKTSTTTVLMVLLAETIALELQPAMAASGFALPADLDARLGLLSLSGPAMARWSFQLRSENGAFMQRINVEMEDCEDYVPLRYGPEINVRAFVLREEMRSAMGFDGPEQLRDLAGTDGFIRHRNCAYLPLGIRLNQVKAAHASGSLRQARDVLPWPETIESVLVCDEEGVRRGISVTTGEEVPVP